MTKTTTSEQGGCPVEILLVEDNPGDLRLTLETLYEGKIQNRASNVTDDAEAIKFLRQQGYYHSPAPRPDLILLDVNLPRKDGREVLAEIKADGALRAIPPVVQTASEAEEDVLRAYDLNVNCYSARPFEIEQIVRVVKSVEDFRGAIVKLTEST
jgi:chemotaxis family two-component system response regulator Rcp1